MKPQWVTDWTKSLREYSGDNVDNNWDMWQSRDSDMQITPLGLLAEIMGCTRIENYENPVNKKLRDIIEQYKDLAIHKYRTSDLTEKEQQVLAVFNDTVKSVIQTELHNQPIHVNTYHYKGKPSEHESPSCLPINLVSVLDCNSPVMFLNDGIRLIVDDNEVMYQDQSIQTLTTSKINYSTIADIIDDFWPLLMFKTAKSSNVLSTLKTQHYHRVIVEVKG
jgi:hypothetical protein